MQEEILALEFRKNDEENLGRISEKNFADLLIAYAGFQPKKRSKMLRRVKKTFDEETSKGVGLTDYLNFYQVIKIKLELNNVEVKGPLLHQRDRHGTPVLSHCRGSH